MARLGRNITAPKAYMTTEALIEQVRIRPALWDESLLEYRDQHRRKALWNAVAGLFIGGSRKSCACLQCDMKDVVCVYV